jgi:hypothetical protein
MANGSGPVRSAGIHSPQEDINLQLIAQIYQFHEAKQIDQILNLLTDDCVFHIGIGDSEGAVPYHGTYQGKAAIAGYYGVRQSLTVRPFCGFILPVLADGPWVICYGRVEDQFKTSRLRVVQSLYVQFWLVDEEQNKVIQMDYFVDTAAAKTSWENAIARMVPPVSADKA